MNARLSAVLLLSSFVFLADAQNAGSSTGSDRVTVGEGRTIFASLRTGFLVTILSALPLKMTVLIIVALLLYGSFYAIRKVLSVLSFRPFLGDSFTPVVREDLEAITRIARALTLTSVPDVGDLPTLTIPDQPCRARAICYVGAFLRHNYSTVAGLLDRFLNSVSYSDVYTSALLRGARSNGTESGCQEAFRECTVPMTLFNFPTRKAPSSGPRNDRHLTY